jgi:hypothetical protein
MSKPPPERPVVLRVNTELFLLNAAEMKLMQTPPERPPEGPARAAGFAPPTERILAVAKVMGELGVGLWRAQQALEKGPDGEPVDRKMHRALEVIQGALTQAGVEVIDRTGTNLSVGHYRDIVVVGTEPSADVQAELIIETIKPAVQWRHGFPHVTPEVVLVQASEVVTKSPLANTGA